MSKKKSIYWIPENFEYKGHKVHVEESIGGYESDDRYVIYIDEKIVEASLPIDENPEVWAKERINANLENRAMRVISDKIILEQIHERKDHYPN